MKAILLALFGLVPLAFAQTTVENDLAALKKIRTEALAKAAEPIDRKFREESEKLLAKAIQSGNLDTAEKIKRELISLETKAAPAAESIAGTAWKRKVEDGTTSIIYFRPDGGYEDYGPKGSHPDVVGWRWVVVGEQQVKVSSGNWSAVYTINGDSIRSQYGTAWTKSTVDEFNKFKGRESTPFGRRKP